MIVTASRNMFWLAALINVVIGVRSIGVFIDRL